MNTPFGDGNSGRLDSKLPTFQDHIVEITGKCLATMLAFEEEVLREADIESVHNMRVWTRHSRAALDVLAYCAVNPKRCSRVQRKVKQLADHLGEVRDLDVMTQILQKASCDLAEPERSGIAFLLSDIRKKRILKQARLSNILTRNSTSTLIQDYDKGFVSCGRRTRCKNARKAQKRSDLVLLCEPNVVGEGPLFHNISEVIKTRIAAIIHYEKYLNSPDNSFELHKMRIAAKRLRFTLEMFENAFAKYAPEFEMYPAAIIPIRNIQENLGAIHDCDVLAPLIYRQIAALIKSGMGLRGETETIIGVNIVDIAGCAGLLKICSEIRAKRARRYALLVTEWEALDANGFFQKFTEQLDAVAILHSTA